MPQDVAQGALKVDAGKVDQRDLDTIRATLTGKWLGRLAALLALIVVVLGQATALDVGLAQIGLPLPPEGWVRWAALFVLPGMVVAAQMVNEFRANRRAEALRKLAATPGAVPSGFFRIGPYEESEADRAAFTRADRAHEKVLAWLKRAPGAPLYLTGQSGCGKSSLLQAFVIPALRDEGWGIVQARAWQDPEAALRKALVEEVGGQHAGELRGLIEAASALAPAGLLVLLDQFEELAILQDEAKQVAFADVLRDLHARPVKGLRLLLAFRTDYIAALEELDLPAMNADRNWRDVGAFTRRAAEEFLKRSNLALAPEAVEALLRSAEREDDLSGGLIRPVTLNVVGHVLTEGSAKMPSLDAGVLVRRHVEQTVGTKELRDVAPAVLETLLTEKGTKRPRRIDEVVTESKRTRGEVRAVLNRLHAAQLARPLDEARSVWELSHDFVAGAVARFLGRMRGSGLRQAGAYAAPALLVAAVAGIGGAVAWERGADDVAIRELSHLGLAVSAAEGEAGRFQVESTSALTQESFDRAERALARIAHRVVSVEITKSGIWSVGPLERLVALQHVGLRESSVEDIESLTQLVELKSVWLPSFFPAEKIDSFIAARKKRSLQIPSVVANYCSNDCD